MGGGISPAKLRNMLKKKEKQEEDEFESTNFSLGSQVSEIEDSGIFHFIFHHFCFMNFSSY